MFWYYFQIVIRKYNIEWYQMNTMFIYIVYFKKEFRKFRNYEKYPFGVYFISLRCVSTTLKLSKEK